MKKIILSLFLTLSLVSIQVSAKPSFLLLTQRGIQPVGHPTIYRVAVSNITHYFITYFQYPNENPVEYVNVCFAVDKCIQVVESQERVDTLIQNAIDASE